MKIFSKWGLSADARKLAILIDNEKLCSVYLWKWRSCREWRDCGIALCLLGYEFSLQYEESRSA